MGSMIKKRLTSEFSSHQAIFLVFVLRFKLRHLYCLEDFFKHPLEKAVTI